MFCTDCNLVFLAVTGGAAQWKRHGWRNASGPVSHLDIWEEVLRLCLRFVGEVCWLKVPAHCGMPGNEDADTLANEGWLDSALYLLPLVAGGVTRSSDEDEGVCQAHDMVDDYSILESVEDCLNYDSDSDGGGYGEGEVPGERPCTPPPLYPGDFWAPTVGVVGRHVAAPLGEPDPEFRIWVQLTPPPPFSSASSLMLDGLSLRLVLHNMGKRSRGPPPGTEERKAKT